MQTPEPARTAVAPVQKYSEPRARLRARLEPGAKPPHLDVTLSLPLAWTKLELRSLELRFREEAFRARAGGYAAFVRGLDQRGRELAWSGIRPAPGPELVVRYRVKLEHAAADPVVGVDEVPHATSGGWFLNGRAFVPHIVASTTEGEKTLDLESELVLELPPGWKLASSAPGEGPRRRAESLAALRDAIYYGGSFSERRLVHGDVAVRLITSDYSDAELAPLADLAERTLALGTALLGPLPRDELLIVYDRASGRAGGVVGRGVTLLHSEPPSSRATSPMGLVVVHELAHLWNTADAMWLREGFARYFELVLANRLDRAGPRALAEALLDAYRAYEQSIGQRALGAATDTVAYHGGATLAFCLDGELRVQKSSLFALHRAVREGGGLGARSFLDALRGRSAPLAERAEQRLAHRGAFDAADCFRNAGFRLAATRYLGFTAEALAVDVLRVGGHETSSARVYRLPEGSPFEEGDSIVSAQGKRVERMHDVDRWLAAVPAGRRFRLEVQRGSARHAIELEMPALGPEARETHRVLTLAPIAGVRSWLASD
jgi:predicted metalloprotease with PDZ domain